MASWFTAPNFILHYCFLDCKKTLNTLFLCLFVCLWIVIGADTYNVQVKVLPPIFIAEEPASKITREMVCLRISVGNKFTAAASELEY